MGNALPRRDRMLSGYQVFFPRSQMSWASTTTVYRVVGMMGDNASVITAAWERIKSKIPVRQTCICHSINLCLEDALEEHDTLRKMRETHQHLEHEKVKPCTSCAVVALWLHTSYTLTL